MDEATALMEPNSSREHALTPDQLLQARFFVAIGDARLSRYAQARKNLALNIQALRSKTTPSIQKFYIYQGLGFYRYFSGRFKLALRYSSLAKRHANLANFSYGQILSYDLFGHSCLRVGQISLALSSWQEALGLSQKLKNSGHAQTLKNTILMTRAKYQLEAPQAVALLQKMAKRFSIDDNYSRAALLIELAEVYLNMGNVALAREVLESAAKIILEKQNYRQEVMLNLKFARIYNLSGQNHQALSAIHLCLRICDSLVDKPLLLEARSLEVRVATELDHASAVETARAELKRLALVSGDYLNARILAREECKNKASKYTVVYTPGEDKIGDLRDIIDKEIAIREILKSGYLSFLFDRLKISPQTPSVVLDLEPNSITLMYQGQVQHAPGGLTGFLRKLLLIMGAKAFFSKEEIVKRIWGYQYNPATHDPLVFNAVNRLRKLFDQYKFLLVLNETGYGLDPRCQVLSMVDSSPNSSGSESFEKLEAPPPISSNSEYAAIPSNLNFRQVKILKILNNSEFTDVRTYHKKFSCATITACRDLTDLTKKGLLERVGRARATKYMLARPKVN